MWRRAVSKGHHWTGGWGWRRRGRWGNSSISSDRCDVDTVSTRRAGSLCCCCAWWLFSGSRWWSRLRGDSCSTTSRRSRVTWALPSVPSSCWPSCGGGWTNGWAFRTQSSSDSQVQQCSSLWCCAQPGSSSLWWCCTQPGSSSLYCCTQPSSSSLWCCAQPGSSSFRLVLCTAKLFFIPAGALHSQALSHSGTAKLFFIPAGALHSQALSHSGTAKLFFIPAGALHSQALSHSGTAKLFFIPAGAAHS